MRGLGLGIILARAFGGLHARRSPTPTATSRPPRSSSAPKRADSCSRSRSTRETRLAAGAVVGAIERTQLELAADEASAQRAATASRVAEIEQQIEALEAQREAARAERAALVAQLEIAQRAYERTARLFAQQAATAQQLDQAERDVRTLGEQIKAQDEQIEAQGQQIEALRVAAAGAARPSAGGRRPTRRSRRSAIASARARSSIRSPARCSPPTRRRARSCSRASRSTRSPISTSVDVRAYVDRAAAGVGAGSASTRAGHRRRRRGRARRRSTGTVIVDRVAGGVHADADPDARRARRPRLRRQDPRRRTRRACSRSGCRSTCSSRPAARARHLDATTAAIVASSAWSSASDATTALDDVSFDVGDGRAVRLHRSGRRRQDDAVPHPRDAARARRGHGARCSASTSCADLWDAPAARRLHARPLLALSRPQRRGEPATSSPSVFGTTVEREYEQIAPIYTQLEPFSDRRAGALSGGMKQKLALCCALVHRPEILFLDEPTTGVDAVSRREFWDLLGAAASVGGLTIVVSTPYMDEATRCDRVALIQRGRMLAIDTPTRDRAVVRAAAPRRARARSLPRAARAAATTRTRTPSIPFGEALHYTDARADAAGRAASPASCARILAAHGHRRRRASSRSRATVEDSFMARMGCRTAARRHERRPAELAIEAQDLTRTLRHLHRRRPHHLRRRRRRGLRLPRRERRGQDDRDPDARPACSRRAAARRRVAGYDVAHRERSRSSATSAT